MEPDTSRLAAPPTDFKRMLSWQLSSAASVPLKKKKKKKKQTQDGHESLTYTDDSDIGSEFDDLITSDPEDNSEYGYAYVVVNSDGEEEVYFSAPESPLWADNDEGISPPTSPRVQTHTSHDHSDLGSTAGRKKSKSKKKKKKIRYNKFTKAVGLVWSYDDFIAFWSHPQSNGFVWKI